MGATSATPIALQNRRSGRSSLSSWHGVNKACCSILDHMAAQCCSGTEPTSILGRLHYLSRGVFVGMISMTRLHMLGLVVATALFATASAHAEGDKAAGRKLVYTCAGCHGVPGYTNAYPQYP